MTQPEDSHQLNEDFVLPSGKTALNWQEAVEAELGYNRKVKEKSQGAVSNPTTGGTSATSEQAKPEVPLAKRSAFKEDFKDELPREKLMKHGAGVLTDVELLAILLGTGIQGMNVLELARHILKQYDNQISRLARANYKDLSKIKGLGPAKAISIVTALELGIRRRNEVDLSVPLTSPQVVADMMCPLLADEQNEQLWLLILNSNMKLITKLQLGTGGPNAVVVDPRMVYTEVLRHGGGRIMLVHNHPSGDPIPSRQDIVVTRKLWEAGQVLGIQLLDHVIVAGWKFHSMADNDQLPSL